MHLRSFAHRIIMHLTFMSLSVCSLIPYITQIRGLLLTKLSALEDLSPTGGAILQTLAEMYLRIGRLHSPTSVAKPEDPSLSAGHLASELAALVPRTLQFLFHSLRTVRYHAATCLLRLLQALPPPLTWLSPPLIHDILRCTYINALTESDTEIADRTAEIFCMTSIRSTPPALEGALSSPGVLQGMFALAASPHGALLDPSHLPQTLASCPEVEVQHRSYEVGANPAALSAGGMRLRAARLLACLLCHAPSLLRSLVESQLIANLQRTSQGSRLLSALTLQFALTESYVGSTAAQYEVTGELDGVIRTLLSASSASAPSPTQPDACYEEVVMAYARLDNEFAALATHCRNIGLDIPPVVPGAGGRLNTDAVLQTVTALAVPAGGRPHELAAVRFFLLFL